jgi:hypothetical protein
LVMDHLDLFLKQVIQSILLPFHKYLYHVPLLERYFEHIYNKKDYWERSNIMD